MVIVGNANAMLDGVKEFTRQKPRTTVRLVKIVSDKLGLLHPFASALTETEDDRPITPVFTADHRKNAFTSNNI